MKAATILTTVAAFITLYPIILRPLALVLI